MKQISYQLSRGLLELNIEKEVEPFENLLGVAERINPKRSFLFVSKVIGRYVPTSLTEMLRVSTLLGEQVPTNLLVGNISVLSLSETALGLGALVHKYYKDLGLTALNAFTSRHLLSVPIRSKFEEPHSHLPSHYVYKSFDNKVNQHFDNTETLILIDDEITTGNTLANLYASLKLTSVKRVILLTLADWSGANSFNWGDVEVYKFSLVSGSYKWTSTTDEVVSLPYNPSDIHSRDELLPIPSQSTRLPSFCGLKIKPRVKSKFDISLREPEQLLCLYYNEMLPQAIEAVIYDRSEENWSSVYFLSLSSSPLEVGHDIQSKIQLRGYYSDIPVYLYNYQETMQSFSDPSLTLIHESDVVMPYSAKSFKSPVTELLTVLDLPNRSFLNHRDINSMYTVNYLEQSFHNDPVKPTFSKSLLNEDGDLLCLF